MPIQDAPPSGGVYFNEPAAPLGSLNDFLASQAPEPAPTLPGDLTPLPTTPEQDRFIVQRNEDQRAVDLGIDPIRARLAKMQAEEAAVRYAGQSEFNQLVSGGATPAEALRRTATKIFFNHPDKMVQAFSRLEAPGVIPSTINAIPIKDASGNIIGSSVFSPEGKLHATHFSGSLSPELQAQRALAGKDINAINQELNALRREKLKAVNAGDTSFDQRIAELEGLLKTARASYLNPGAQIPSEVAAKPETSTPAAKRIQSADFIRRQYRDKKISREDALKSLRELGYE